MAKGRRKGANLEEALVGAARTLVQEALGKACSLSYGGFEFVGEPGDGTPPMLATWVLVVSDDGEGGRDMQRRLRAVVHSEFGPPASIVSGECEVDGEGTLEYRERHEGPAS